MASKYDDPLFEAAWRLGREKGENMGKLIITHTTGVDAASTLLNGFQDNDEEVMDICPNPLSGEWADDPTPIKIIEDIASLAEAKNLLNNIDIEKALDQAEDVLDIFEEAYRDGFWETALKRASEIVEANE